MSAIFSADADSIVTRAKSIAFEASHEYVGTEHFFAAICEAGVVEIVESLERHKINVATVIDKVRAIGRGRQFSADQLPFTPKAKEVLCRAIELTDVPPVTLHRVLYAILEAACFSKGSNATAALCDQLEIPLEEMRETLLKLEPPHRWPPDRPPRVSRRS